MEFCGAGSVSDIIRIRDKTVRKYTHKFMFMCQRMNISCMTVKLDMLCVVAKGRRDRHHPASNSEGFGVSSLHEENPQRHQGRKHPAELRGTGQAG